MITLKISLQHSFRNPYPLNYTAVSAIFPPPQLEAKSAGSNVVFNLSGLAAVTFIFRQLDFLLGRYPASEASCGIGVQGVANSVVSCLSPPRGLHWEKFLASGKVGVDAQNVLH